MKTKQQLSAMRWATMNLKDEYFLVFLNEKNHQFLIAVFCQMEDEVYPNTDNIHCMYILQAWVVTLIQVPSGTMYMWLLI